jgi:nucleotide-binding universal stress UspA family protein
MTARPVLVGTDGSQASLRAVAWAAREAATHEQPLLIVSALAPPPRMSSPWSAAAVHETAQRRTEDALTASAEHARQVAPALCMGTEVLHGEPALALASRADGASMLVVGSRGTESFAAMALGSVSRYAATHAACPVVVVRPEGRPLYREIVVGVRDPDLPGTSAALKFAFAEAALRKARLLAVHAWYWAAPAGHPGQPDEPRDTAHRMADALAEYQDKFPGVEVATDVARAHPGRVLAGASARADLVVVGRHDARVAGGPVARLPAAGGNGARGIGSVTRTVLSHGRGPLAIVADR